MSEREKLEAEQRGQTAHAPVQLETNLREVGSFAIMERAY